MSNVEFLIFSTKQEKIKIIKSEKENKLSAWHFTKHPVVLLHLQ